MRSRTDCAAAVRRRLAYLSSIVAGVAGALSLALAGPANAGEAPFIGWSAQLPALVSEYDPASEDDCISGRTKCVDKVIRQMTKQFNRLGSSCDHDAIFQLSYPGTTEEYRRTIDDPNFFEDTAFVNHEDAVFARFYFEPYEAWHEGRRGEVPPAWRIALSAADDRAVSGTGNLFLGINAHIQRDLAFVLYGIGLVGPDGSTRKADHDKVNQFLNRVQAPLIAELADRFDPTIDDSSQPGPYDDLLTFQAVVGWREAAWRNAERLANAGSESERDAVAQSIEDYAVSQALAMRLATRYGPLGAGSAPPGRLLRRQQRLLSPPVAGLGPATRPDRSARSVPDMRSARRWRA